MKIILKTYSIVRNIISWKNININVGLDIMYKNSDFEIYGIMKHELKYSDGTYDDEYYMILFLNNIKPE